MYKIFVGNLGFQTTEEKLRRIFEPLLDIEDLVIARDAEGKSRGYAFVMTRDAIRGRRAVAQVDKFFIDGRQAYAKEAHGGKGARLRKRARAVNRRRGGHRLRPMRGGRGGGKPAPNADAAHANRQPATRG